MAEEYNLDETIRATELFKNEINKDNCEDKIKDLLSDLTTNFNNKKYASHDPSFYAQWFRTLILTTKHCNKYYKHLDVIKNAHIKTMKNISYNDCENKYRSWNKYRRYLVKDIDPIKNINEIIDDIEKYSIARDDPIILKSILKNKELTKICLEQSLNNKQ